MKDQTRLLQWRVGAKTIGENLDKAVDDGRLIRHDDGTYELSKKPDPIVDPWMYSRAELRVSCDKQLTYIFRDAYASSAVPSNCRACYKVKIVARTLRELVAIHEIAKTTAYVYKCGIDTIPTSRALYSAFFYADGLPEARAMYAKLRAAVDANAKLGLGVAMIIKRGCTEYELHCGPSDKYTFAPELPNVEASLLALVRKGQPGRRRTAADGVRTLALWIQTAFKHGDDTYLDFTNGRELYPLTVSYRPVEDP